MNNIVKQILIGSVLGDGHITKSGRFQTGSKYLEWVTFKASILKEYTSNKWYNFIEENGYSKTPYHTMRTLISSDIKKIYKMSLPQLLEELDEIGLAVWVYDDGSFHKNNLFYNLNTHSFTLQEHIQYIIPALAKFGVIAEVMKERKKDNRIFYYTYISKRRGAQIINKILKKYPIECYSYKTYKGNINDTLTYKFVKTTNIKTGKEIIHEGINIASKYIKSYTVALRKGIKLKIPIKGYLVEYYYYE